MFESLSDRFEPEPSRICVARVDSPEPTSTPRAARSGSRSSRPTSRSPSSAPSSPRSRSARRARGLAALNPAQQVVKIVNEELVGILGGETRRLQFAKTPPTVIMLAGLQGSGKTTLAGKLAKWLKDQGHTPCSSRVTSSVPAPSASCRSSVSAPARPCSRRTPAPPSAVARTRSVSRPPTPSRSRAPVSKRPQQAVRRRDRRHRRPPRHRRGADGAGRGHPRRRPARRDDLRARRHDRQDAVHTAEAFKSGVGFTGVVLTKLDGDAAVVPR